MKKCLIHYFTGTGNTYHLIKSLENRLKEKGYEVRLISIEKSVEKAGKSSEKNGEKYNGKHNEKYHEPDSLHIFAFPVYGFGTPRIMVKYLKNLESVNDSKAVVLCTSGGFEGQALTHVHSLLKKKGFTIVYRDMLQYTYNWTQVINPQSKQTEENVFAACSNKIVDVVNNIEAGIPFYKKQNIIAVGISWIVYFLYTNFGRKILGKTFISDSSCNGCGLCQNVCPAGVIKLRKKRPQWNSRCEGCQRCINICPKKSIQLSVGKLFLFLIATVIPIFMVVKMPVFQGFPVIINILLCCLLIFVATIAFNYLIFILEKIKVIRRIFQLSYTKKYRRNLAKGFRIE